MKTTNKITLTIIAMMIITLCALSAHATLDDSSLVSLSLVNQDPDPAIAGDIVEIRLGIQNLGGESAENVLVEIDPQYPFSPVPGEDSVQKVESLQGYQGYYESESMKILKFKVRTDRDAQAGSYEFNVDVYEEGSDVTIQKTLSVDVKSRENAEVIHIDKTILVPGKQSSLRFMINNVGNAPLRDMKFYWENEDGIILPVGSDNTRYVKYLEIGDSAEIEYQVIADSSATAGLYKLNLYLTYADSFNGSDKTISTIAGVYVGGETDFDVAFSESSGGQTSFSISNIGSNPANSVSVMIPEQRGWTVTGSNAAIIGNLNKGDYTVASFKLQSEGASSMNRTGMSRTGARMAGGAGTAGTTDQTGAQQRPMIAGGQFNASQRGNFTTDKIIIQISYTDTMGERRTIEKTVKLSASSIASGNAMALAGRTTTTNQGFFATYKWYLIGAVLLIVSYLAYKKYSERKLTEPDFKIKNMLSKKKK
jgi:hypothetical protein